MLTKIFKETFYCGSVIMQMSQPFNIIMWYIKCKMYFHFTSYFELRLEQHFKENTVSICVYNVLLCFRNKSLQVCYSHLDR